MGKNYKLYNVGDRVVILHCSPYANDKGRVGTIQEVRHSFCKILLDGEQKTINHCYKQFKKVEDESI